MLATARIEALELWVASEIVGPIIDKAISVVRRRIVKLRKIWKEAAGRVPPFFREHRNPESEYHNKTFRKEYHKAKRQLIRAHNEYNDKLEIYLDYREWQNIRWKIPAGSRYRALPEAARHTRPAP